MLAMSMAIWRADECSVFCDQWAQNHDVGYSETGKGTYGEDLPRKVRSSRRQRQFATREELQTATLESRHSFLEDSSSHNQNSPITLPFSSLSNSKIPTV